MLLLLAASVQAAVTVSCAQVGTTNDVDVSYTVTGPNNVRAFALDLSVSAGTITGVTCSNTSYYIYPGSIQISSGSVSGYGSCVCSTAYPGTQGGVGTSAVTVEMGSLYTGTNKPASSGLLFRFTVDTVPTTVTLTANTIRRGVVMENPYEDPAPVLSGCTLSAASVDCFPSTYVGYSDWKTLGKPDCWCGTNTAGMKGTVAWKFQCYGDADNKTQDLSGKYRVYTNDYWKMKSNWKKKDSQFPGSGNCPIPE